MIACPECGGKTRSTESRITPSGARRRRECANGHRVTTIEVIVPTGQRHGSVALVREDRIAEARDAAAKLSAYLAAVLDSKERP